MSEIRAVNTAKWGAPWVSGVPSTEVCTERSAVHREDFSDGSRSSAALAGFASAAESLWPRAAKSTPVSVSSPSHSGLAQTSPLWEPSLYLKLFHICSYDAGTVPLRILIYTSNYFTMKSKNICQTMICSQMSKEFIQLWMWGELPICPLTMKIGEMAQVVRCLWFFGFVSVLSTSHKLDSSGKKELWLRKCLQQIGL